MRLKKQLSNKKLLHILNNEKFIGQNWDKI
jgi:hypothetical protein